MYCHFFSSGFKYGSRCKVGKEVHREAAVCRQRDACGECSSAVGPADAACFDFLSYCQWKALSRQMVGTAPGADAVPGWMKMHGEDSSRTQNVSKPWIDMQACQSW